MFHCDIVGLWLTKSMPYSIFTIDHHIFICLFVYLFLFLPLGTSSILKVHVFEKKAIFICVEAQSGGGGSTEFSISNWCEYAA